MNIQKRGKMKTFGTFVFGFITGIVVVAIIGWKMMPGMMLVEHQSRYDSVEETCKQLKVAIEAGGWKCPATRDMNNSIGKYGFHMDTQVRIVELCNAKYARDVLTTNPEISTLMPCAWGVYEGKDGKIYISGMNMGLMGKMFGGNISRVMGGAVSKEEKQMLEAVISE